MNRRIFYAFSGVMVLFVSGMVYAWSVFSSSIAGEYVGWSKASLSLIFTFVMLFFCVGGLIGGFMLSRFKSNCCVLVSALFFLTGFLISSKAKSPTTLCIGFGFFCGIGAGLSYNSVISSISKWFPNSQGMISGVLLMGFGFSSFIVGKIFQAMSSSFSWREIFFIFGIASSAVLFSFSFFIRRPETTGKKKEKASEPSDYSIVETIRRPAFYFFFIWAVLMSAAGLSLVSQASGIVETTSVPSNTIATLVGVISIFNGFGRVGFGVLFDKKGCKTVLRLIHISMLLSSISLCLATKFQSVWILILGFILGGLGYGGITCTNSTYVGSTFGMKNYPRNFPIMTMNLLFASFGSTIAGSLLDLTNSYFSVYLFMAGLTTVGFFVSLAIIRSRRALLDEAD